MDTPNPTPPPPPPKLKKPPVLFHKTQQVIEQIERTARKRGATFLSYWSSPNGSVCQDDVIGFYEILRKLGKQKHIYFFIKSDGGNGRASLRIINLLRQYAERLTALVPLNCASAATMMALGADEIRMGPLAYLTAVDTAITHDLSPIDKDNYRVSVSQNELTRILRLWRENGKRSDGNALETVFKYVHPLVVGAVDRASSLSIRLCHEILSYHMTDKTKINRIATALNENYPSHGYPITLREARSVGLAVKPLDDETNELLIALNEMYAEMGQKAQTDFDETHHHDNEILNIIEGSHIQVYYQLDKDWHYRSEERRWVSMNDKSSWRKMLKVGKKTEESTFFVR